MGFNFEVKLFALSRRSEGKRWGEIRRAIKERFNIAPPTVRSLQKWEKETDRGVLDHALKEKAKKEGLTLTDMAGRKYLNPLLTQAKIARNNYLRLMKLIGFEKVLKEKAKRRVGRPTDTEIHRREDDASEN